MGKLEVVALALLLLVPVMYASSLEYTSTYLNKTYITVDNPAPTATALQIKSGSSGSNTGFLRLENTNPTATSGSSVEFFGRESNGVIAEQARVASSLTDSTPGVSRSDLLFLTKDAAAGMTQKMVIQSNGNIGMGTPSPASRLDVQGGSRSISVGQAVSGNSAGLQFRADGVKHVGLRFDGTRLIYEDASGGTDPNVWNYAPYTADFIVRKGNLGIGTMTPAEKLVVQGDHGSTKLRIFSDHYGQGADGANTALLTMWASEPGASWTGGGIGNNMYNSGVAPNYFTRITATRGGSYVRLLDNSIRFNVVDAAGTDRNALTIDGAGNVAATGTIAAAGVTVGGNQVCTAANGLCAAAGGGSVGGGWVNTTTQTTTQYVVGIGTTAPTTTLDLRGNLFIGNGGSFSNGEGWDRVIDMYSTVHDRISLRAGAIDTRLVSHVTGWGGITAAAGVVGTQTPHPFGIMTNGQSRITVTPGGYVGIGTTTPTGKLQVAGAHANGVMDDGNDRPSIAATGYYPQMVLMAGGTGNTNHGPTFMIGSYDSGTSGANKHWSIGTSGQQSSFLDIGYHAGTDVNPHAGIRNYNGQTVMTLLGNGNVGIGTLSPGAKLAVGGPGGNFYATDIWAENNIHVQGPETLAAGGRGRLRVGTAWGYSGLYTDGSSTGAANDLLLGSSTGTVRVGPPSVPHNLVVSGNIYAQGNQQVCTAANGLCASASTSQWLNSGSNIYFSTGNVGVGAVPAAYRMDILGNDYTNSVRIYSAAGIGPSLSIHNTGASGRKFDLISCGTGSSCPTWPNANRAGYLGIFDETAGIYSAYFTSGYTIVPSLVIQNQWVYSNYGGVVMDANGQVGKLWSTRRMKEEIQPMQRDFTRILDAQPVTFRYKNTTHYDYGYIAEDIDALGLKDLVIYDKDGRPESLHYGKFPIYQLEVLKEQQRTIESQQERLEQQQAEIDDLNARLERLERAYATE